jgi:dTDP-4-dehydrorhamnose 3,5-epimerase
LADSNEEIEGSHIFIPKRHGDDRGFFSETWNAKTMAEAGIDTAFVQDNHSLSADVGTLRGLHFQAPPFAQAKLVRVVRGSVFDVVVDIRVGSPTFAKYVSTILSAENWKQLYVPNGFLHGFMTLEPDTEVIYKVSNFYEAVSDGGVIWNDPDLDIEWPDVVSVPVLSEKDEGLPAFADFASPFIYQA